VYEKLLKEKLLETAMCNRGRGEKAKLTLQFLTSDTHKRL
jgi:hypothetical protein